MDSQVGHVGEAFCEQVAVMNIKEVLSAPRAPWQRAYDERMIGSFVVHNNAERF
jgi:hypothetical protein